MEVTGGNLRTCFSIVVFLAAIVLMVGLTSRMHVMSIKAFFWDSNLRRCRCFGPVVAGLIAQVLLNPLVGGLIISCFPEVDKRLRVAAMIIMCSSGGMGSNLMTYITYGNFEASVVLTACSTLMTVVTFPTSALLTIKVIWKLDEEGMDFPHQTFAISVALFVLPVVVGVLLQSVCTARALVRLSAVGVGSGIVFLLLGAMIFLADEEARDAFFEFGRAAVFLLAIILNVVGLLMGYLVGYLCGFSPEYQRTMAFEVGAQNLILPLGVISMTFPAAEQHVYVTMVIAYSISQSLVTLPFALALRFFYPLPDVIERRKRSLGTAAADDPGLPGPGSPPAEHSEDNDVKVEL